MYQWEEEKKSTKNNNKYHYTSKIYFDHEIFSIALQLLSMCIFVMLPIFCRYLERPCHLENLAETVTKIIA